ncbi:GNAT family N-acetyltransferase [Vibrio sp. PP-XX7]
MPEVQHSGWGRRLIETELDALTAAHVTGVHLGVNLHNERVCDFYEKLGFTHIFRRNAIYMGRRPIADYRE